MSVIDWNHFMFLLQKRKLPRSCDLSAVYTQIYRFYLGNRITLRQWREFEAGFERISYGMDGVE